MYALIKHQTTRVLLVLLVTTFAACNKENVDAEKALQVLINGYNGESNNWEISIDTTSYNTNTYIIKPASIIGFNVVYTYRSKKERFVNITDAVTKKVLFSKPLPQTGTKANFNFIYIDGHEVPVTPPPVAPATNKLGFYVHNVVDNEPFDIFLYRRDEATGEEYRHYLVKNVMPKTWVYVDYMAPADFATKNMLDLSSIYFTKAGTTDQWAIQDNEEMSKISAAGLGFPLLGEKGLVLPYFLTPGQYKLEMSRLFFSPDRF